MPRKTLSKGFLYCVYTEKTYRELPQVRNAEISCFIFSVYDEWRKYFPLQYHRSPRSSLTSHQSLPSCFRDCTQSAHVFCCHLSRFISFFSTYQNIEGAASVTSGNCGYCQLVITAESHQVKRHSYLKEICLVLAEHEQESSSFFIEVRVSCVAFQLWWNE